MYSNLEYPHALFSVIGLEIEYMLVDADTLNIQPKSDVLLTALAGTLTNAAILDQITISNELVLHVIELKNHIPQHPCANLAQLFQKTIEALQPLLKIHNLTLLPSASHPWMNPYRETRRWLYDNHDIYRQYDAIFNCNGHGWSNLQSMHVNLPFANDQEFFHLHSAIRILLPLLPAISASSPFLEGKITGMQDTRLHFYGSNQQKIPSISGRIIPEFIRSLAEYQNTILNPMFNDIKPFDPDGILQFSWLNSRGAIPKPDCGAIEIRIIDSQECVNADIAIANAIFAILQHWLQNPEYLLDHPCATEKLYALYQQTIKFGLGVYTEDAELQRQWQLTKAATHCRTVWEQLLEKVSSKLDCRSQLALEKILSQGNLSDRLLRAVNRNQSHSSLARIYNQLTMCLLHNQQLNVI